MAKYEDRHVILNKTVIDSLCLRDMDNKTNLNFEIIDKDKLDARIKKVKLLGGKVESIVDTFIAAQLEDNVTIYSSRAIKAVCIQLFSSTMFKSIDLTNLDCSDTTLAISMFNNCVNIESINIGNIDTRMCNTMSFMFSGCRKLKTIDISSLNTSKLESTDRMFDNCIELEEVILGDFQTDKLQDTEHMFNNCHKLKSIKYSSFKLPNKVNTSGMFTGCDSLNCEVIKDILNNTG